MRERGDARREGWRVDAAAGANRANILRPVKPAATIGRAAQDRDVRARYLKHRIGKGVASRDGIGTQFAIRRQAPRRAARFFNLDKPHAAPTRHMVK